jgi:uncharacterized protein (DUF1501 family)
MLIRSRRGFLRDALASITTLGAVGTLEYAATMAQWFGVSPGATMAQVFPNLANFNSSNLGFLG